jgi:phosphatidylinositol alpha-1,6-mannosyltransferase
MWTLAAFLRQRPDLVFPMNVAYGGIVCLLLSTVATCRYVAMAYGYEFLKFARSPALRRLYNSVYRRSDFVIAVSRYTRRRLIDFGVEADRIRVVYPGVAAPAERDGEWRRAGAEGAPYRIGTCGRLIHRKGHDLVLRALPRIRAVCPGVRYVIAGEGPARPGLETLARELGVTDCVEFVGRVPERELSAYYASLDLFVMPSREDHATGHVEGFGIVFLEAAAHGVASVATRAGGIPEAVLDGTTGRLVPPECPDALAEAIADLLLDPATLRRYGESARRRALTEFAWDAQVDRIHKRLTTGPPSIGKGRGRGLR